MIEIVAVAVPGVDEVLALDALAFLADLQATFGPRREELMHARRDRQAALDAGADLDFDAATADLRAANWTVRPAPADFDDRRGETPRPAPPQREVKPPTPGA